MEPESEPSSVARPPSPAPGTQLVSLEALGFGRARVPIIAAGGRLEARAELNGSSAPIKLTSLFGAISGGQYMAPAGPPPYSLDLICAEGPGDGETVFFPVFVALGNDPETEPLGWIRELEDTGKTGLWESRERRMTLAMAAAKGTERTPALQAGQAHLVLAREERAKPIQTASFSASVFGGRTMKLVLSLPRGKFGGGFWLSEGSRSKAPGPSGPPQVLEIMAVRGAGTRRVTMPFPPDAAARLLKETGIVAAPRGSCTSDRHSWEWTRLRINPSRIGTQELIKGSFGFGVSSDPIWASYLSDQAIGGAADSWSSFSLVSGL